MDADMSPYLSLVLNRPVYWLFTVLCLLHLNTTASGQEPSPLKKWVVATRQAPPFAMKKADGEWEGISIDLLRRMHKDLEAENGAPIELEFHEMGLPEMLSAVEAGDVDLAAAALTVNHERETRMDFTHPFHQSGLGIAVNTRPTQLWDTLKSTIFSPGVLKVTLGLLAVLLLVGVTMYLIERKRNAQDFGEGPVRGVGVGVWWAAVTLTTVGYGDTVPRSPAGRVLGFFWMFAGLFIIATFTATLTSSLTIKQLESSVAGPEDLPRVRVATVGGSTSEAYLQSLHVNAVTFPTVKQALAALHSDEADAVVYDLPILRYEIHQHFSGKVHVLPVTLERQSYAFALPQDSPLREPFNRALLQENVGPAWKELTDQYLGKR